MKRKLIQQMLNEWRSNIWLLLELAITMLVLTYICGYLYSLYDEHGYPTGRRLHDIYTATVHELSKESDRYVPYDSAYMRQQDLDTLLARLRSNPYVEMVATGDNQSMPYSFRYYGSSFMYRTDTGFSDKFETQVRPMTPELIELLGIRGVRGETPRQLADILRKGYTILANPEIRDSIRVDAKGFLGRDTVYAHDSMPEPYRVGAIAYGLRRYDYEPTMKGTAYIPINQLSTMESVIVVRVKPGMGRQFEKSITTRDTESGNLYINRYRSIDTLRDETHREINLNIRNFIFCAVVILLMVFLAFLGTFWLRTQQRMEEIAIRKVNGATDGDIYRRCFSEGMILLAVAAAAVLLFPCGIMHTLDISNVTRRWITVGYITAVVLLALPILAGIYAPARLATRIKPVDALKDM